MFVEKQGKGLKFSSISGIMEFRMKFVIRLLKVVRLLLPRISQTCHMPWNIYATTWSTRTDMFTQQPVIILNLWQHKNIRQLWTQKAHLLPLSYIFSWLNLCRLNSHSSITRSFLFLPSFILSSQLFSPLFSHIFLYLIYNSFMYLFI